MKTGLLLVLVVLIVAVSGTDAVSQTAGSSVVGVSTTEVREVAAGWSAKKKILGKDVFNESGEKIGTIEDLIVAPNRALSYAIVGVGGFLGIGSHDVAIPVSQFREAAGRIVLPGATKDALKAAPKFEYGN
jgi:sporulation protein YlmC with PRC-barrel domain